MSRGLNNRKKYTTYLRNLKKQKKRFLDSLFYDADIAAFNHIDCLVCGRCCTNLGPRLKNRDLQRLSRREGMKPSTFSRRFLKTDDDGDLVFLSMPCPFFGSDGTCTVYEDRPDACRDYPHMDQGRQLQFIDIHIENLVYCPAVILAVEKLIADSRIPQPVIQRVHRD